MAPEATQHRPPWAARIAGGALRDLHSWLRWGVVCAAILLSAPGAAAVEITDGPEQVLSRWDALATATINEPPAARGTAAERRPFYPADLATLHLAMHDALAATRGQPGLMKSSPREAWLDALPEAAAATAAYRVLQGLYPARRAHYEAAYAREAAAWPAGSARDQGQALGAAAAARALALRAEDGRSAVLPPFVPGSGPGEFRGVNPIGRHLPGLKPFLARSLQSYRAPGPPPLTSTRYAAAWEEVRALGGSDSVLRTPEQLAQARFHLEPPHTAWPRNLRRLARHGTDLLQSARLMALLYVTHSDAYAACFESKYHYRFWRPVSAVRDADLDGNPATEPDPGWVPALTVPNHPEYPSAHACLFGAAAALLEMHFGTAEVRIPWDSSTSSEGRTFRHLGALRDESDLARIAGGMHFRFAVEDGKRLGEAVVATLRAQLAAGEGL